MVGTTSLGGLRGARQFPGAHRTGPDGRVCQADGWAIYNPGDLRLRFNRSDTRKSVDASESTSSISGNDMAADKTLPSRGRSSSWVRYARPGLMRSAGLFRVLQQAANDFAQFRDEVDAGLDHWRGQGERTGAGAAGEARRHERLVCSPARYRALDHGGTPPGDGRCADALSWRGTDEGALKSTTQEGRRGYGI